MKFIQEVNIVIPIKTLVSGSAKEIERWCVEKGIKRHLITPHHHQSNGRIEQLNKTILEAVNKQSHKRSLAHRVLRAIMVYNRVKNTKIKMSPEEARNPSNWNLIRENFIYKQLLTIYRKATGLKLKFSRLTTLFL
ncbi:hypothetical protein NGRA_1797 [Nosema granulosis]|uniref:Integrase catalytic domain-containing protein n=1 Tax=Nosema granulosis TaxID=83296 RepID=A0A9P6GXR7_9MICR|nr:hypothetical protein NGRA_1797 [Nosema granulosis]